MAVVCSCYSNLCVCVCEYSYLLQAPCALCVESVLIYIVMFDTLFCVPLDAMWLPLVTRYAVLWSIV